MQAFVDTGSFQQVVRDYQLVLALPATGAVFEGNSYALKSIVREVPPSRADPVSVLDIGFGVGSLAALLKSQPDTEHWQVDGVDGYYPTCCNRALFERRHYRHVWHGLASAIPAQQLKNYDLVCLFDVIEHLDAAAATQLLTSLLAGLGEHSRLVLSTPLFFWVQPQQQAGDLEEHLIGIPPASMLGLGPRMFHIDRDHLVGTFVFDRTSLARIAQFKPTTDKSYDQAAARDQLGLLGLAADSVVYSCSG